MRKWFSISLIIPIFLLSFSGCIKVEYEIKNLTVIQGIGIDYDEEKQEYEVTVEIFDISQSSGMGEAQAGNLTKIVHETGNSVSESLRKIELEIGRTIVYSQKRAIIVGKSALKMGLTNVMSFFLKDYKTRSSVLVGIADEVTAKDVIEATEGDASFPSREIQNLLQSGKINGYTTEVDVALLSRMSEDNSSDVYLPLINLKEEKKSDKETKYTCLNGFAIVKNDKYVGKLSLTEGRGLLFINNQIDSGSININGSKIGSTTLDIVKSKTSIKTEALKKPHFTVNIDCTVDVVERQGGNKSTNDKEDAELIERDVSLYIKDCTDKALEKCLDDHNADVFFFHRRLWILYPTYYRNLEDRTIKSDNVKVNVNTKVRHVSNGNE